MEKDNESRSAWTPRYEVVFSIFLAAVAFLWRDNVHMVYPQALHLLLVMMTLNLGAGIVLRRVPGHSWLAAAITLANAGVVTSVVAYSGGADSNLWTLYLLPIFTACVLLDRRAAAWVTAGAVSFNAAYHLLLQDVQGEGDLFSLALKSGVLVFAAATTCRLVQRQRRASERVCSQREELALLEKELDRHRSDLEGSRSLAEVGMAASGVAHDLKTPLLVIQATVELLSDQEAAEGLKRDLERIRSAARHCQDIVMGVLDRAQERNHDDGACSLEEAVEGALDLCRPGLGDRGVAVRSELPGRLPAVAAGAVDLRRVFQNLLWNARDAMPSGGLVVVGARQVAGPAGPEVEAWVEDSGPGIPAERREALFQPFATTKKERGGTGLGLYLCREILTKNGGGIAAEAGPHGGARFVLRLNAVPVRQADGAWFGRGAECFSPARVAP